MEEHNRLFAHAHVALLMAAHEKDVKELKAALGEQLKVADLEKKMDEQVALNKALQGQLSQLAKDGEVRQKQAEEQTEKMEELQGKVEAQQKQLDEQKKQIEVRKAQKKRRGRQQSSKR